MGSTETGAAAVATGAPSLKFSTNRPTTDVPFLRKSSFFFVSNRTEFREFNDPGALSTTGLGLGPRGDPHAFVRKVRKMRRRFTIHR